MANGRDDRDDEEKKAESQTARFIKAALLAIMVVVMVWSYKQGEKEKERENARPKSDAAQVEDGGRG